MSTSSQLGLLDALDPSSRARIRIFSFKLLVLFPIAQCCWRRNIASPCLTKSFVLAFWYGFFSGAVALVRWEQVAGPSLERVGRDAGLFRPQPVSRDSCRLSWGKIAQTCSPCSGHSRHAMFDTAFVLLVIAVLLGRRRPVPAACRVSEAATSRSARRGRGGVGRLPSVGVQSRLVRRHRRLRRRVCRTAGQFRAPSSTCFCRSWCSRRVSPPMCAA